jgi:hypothetical protein
LSFEGFVARMTQNHANPASSSYLLWSTIAVGAAPGALSKWLPHVPNQFSKFELRQQGQNSLKDISTTEHPLIKGYRSQAQPVRFFLCGWCIRSQGLTDKARARCPKTVTLADTAARSIEPK